MLPDAACARHLYLGSHHPDYVDLSGPYSFRLDPDDDKAIEQPPRTRSGQQVRAASPDHANVSDISMHNTLDIDEKAAAPNLLQVPPWR